MDPFRPNPKKQMPEKAVAKLISINLKPLKTSHMQLPYKKNGILPRFFPGGESSRLAGRHQVVPDRGFSQETFWPQGSLPRRSSRGRTRKA